MILSYDIPNDIAIELVDALCHRYGYSATLPDPVNPGETIPNPETRNQFAKRQAAEWFKGELRAYRRMLAEQAANAVVPEIT